MLNKNLSYKKRELLTELTGFSKEFRGFSKQFFTKKQKLVKKYPALIARFYKELEEFGSGGKAIRPFLVYLGYLTALREVQPDVGLNLKDVRRILPVCLAFELIHNFLLVHDDIIDKSPTRRGKSTIHKKFARLQDEHYGLSQAIVLGDIACLEAFELVNEVPLSQERKSKCLQVLINVIIETGYGEALDVEYSYRRPKFAQVMQVIELKTARYSFVGPLTIGALLGDASQKQIAALQKYGLLTGRAFQLQDDILGVFGNEKTIGKSTLSDMREGKNTLLFYKTRELADPRQRRLLERVWGDNNATDNDLTKVRKIMEQSGALKWCQREMGMLVKDAKKSVRSITTDKKLVEIFAQCADFVVNREK